MDTQTPAPIEKIRDLAQLILDSVGIDSVDVNTLDADTQLGPQGLGLDSIDILEVVAAVEDQFKVKVADAKEGSEHFQTLGSILNFINVKQGVSAS